MIPRPCDWPYDHVDEAARPIERRKLAFIEAVVDAMIKSGADINRGYYNGRTVLMDAASKGQEEVVRMLLAKGADPARKIDNGNSALNVAIVEARYGENIVSCSDEHMKQAHRNIVTLLGGKLP